MIASITGETLPTFTRITPPPLLTCFALMVSYWSQVCTAQRERSPLQLQQANYGSGIFAVRALIHFRCRRALSLPLTHRAGFFVRFCCSVQWDMVCAVGQDASVEAA